MGFSISIPAESKLVLYPYSHRAVNPFNTSAGLRRHLQPAELPEVALKGARELVLDDADRDVVMFPGSTTWHLRRHAANALNLYLKFNDFGLRPARRGPLHRRPPRAHDGGRERSGRLRAVALPGPLAAARHGVPHRHARRLARGARGPCLRRGAGWPHRAAARGAHDPRRHRDGWPRSRSRLGDRPRPRTSCCGWPRSACSTCSTHRFRSRFPCGPGSNESHAETWRYATSRDTLARGASGTMRPRRKPDA